MAIADRTFIDTDILVDVARGYPRAIQFWRRVSTESLICCSVISILELLAGCRSRQEQTLLLKNLVEVEIVHMESGDSLEAFHWYRKFHLSQGVGFLDCFIAAAAVRLGCTLHTLNVKHFRPIPELQIKRPY